MKYIIDIPNDDVGRWIGGTPYGLKLFVPLSIEDCGEYHIKTEIPVEPYIEPVRKAIEDKVWDFVRTCLVMDGSDFVDAFDSCSYINLLEHSYQEAKAKYDEWKKQKDEIHVGNEVENASYKKGIVLNHYISPSSGLEYVRVLYMDDDGNSFISAWEKKDVCKTGRHFDEVVTLLEKMREVKNN